MISFTDRLTHAWNAFRSPYDPNDNSVDSDSYVTRKFSRRTNSSSFVSPIYNKIALDVAMTTFEHVKENKDDDGFVPQKSGLNYCLQTEANLDQSNVAFLQDVVFSMFDEGAVAIVPTDTSINPVVSGSFDILKLRAGKILDFRTKTVKVRLYNEKNGKNEDIWLDKTYVAIIENPLYAVVNHPNSTLQRLLSKMDLLDNFDAAVNSGKLDIIVQRPNPIKTKLQHELAMERLDRLEEQLFRGQHGIVYIDGAEKVVQLNRAANNQLLESIKILNEQFYNQLGLTPKVFDGTASEAEMRNYYNRTIDPIVTFLVKEMERKFFTKTSRTQGHKIYVTRNNFKLVPIEQLINLGDTLRRNQIATSNELRKVLGFNMIDDPLADELANPNLAVGNRGNAISSIESGIPSSGKTPPLKKIKQDGYDELEELRKIDTTKMSKAERREHRSKIKELQNQQ